MPATENPGHALPDVWGLIDLLGVPVPAADTAVNELLTGPGITPAVREILTAAITLAGHVDDAAAREAGIREGDSVTAYAHTLLAGPFAKELADALMRAVDAGRIPADRSTARALDLSYERIFALTHTERTVQFRTPIALLAAPRRQAVRAAPTHGLSHEQRRSN